MDIEKRLLDELLINSELSSELIYDLLDLVKKKYYYIDAWGVKAKLLSEIKDKVSEATK